MENQAGFPASHGFGAFECPGIFYPFHAGIVIVALTMTLLPIVERELRVTARRAGIYRSRCLIPILLLGIVGLQLVFLPFVLSPSSMGPLLYYDVAYLTLAVCALEGVRQTADCISSERREGTLGLLFLTDLNGFDVVLGKLAAAAAAALHGLIAMVPILGCAVILGGVTFAEIVRVALSLVCVLSFSLAAGVWVSSRSRSASHALGGTILLVAAVLAGPLAVFSGAAAFLSPACAFLDAPASMYASQTAAYWASLLVTPIICLLLLVRAAVNTNQYREDFLEKSSGGAAQDRRKSKFGELVDANPVLWLAARGGGAGILMWMLVILAAAGLAWFWPGRGIFWKNSLAALGLLFAAHLTLKIFLAARACQCLAEARRNSTLEIMLCTPLQVQDILRGQILSLTRLFLKPFLALMALEMVYLYQVVNHVVGASSGGPVQEFFAIVVGLEVAFGLFFLLDIQGVAWTGIWFGLCSKNESTATFKTAAYVILAPMLFLILNCVGWAVFIAWPIAAYYWARLQLQEHFRFLAGLRLTSQKNLTEWLPFHVPNLPVEPGSD